MVLHCAFSGDRHWTDMDRIREVVEGLPLDTVVIHGGQGHVKANGMPIGVDKIVDIVARERGLTVEVYPADWDRYHNGAGPIRNGTMVMRLNQARKEGHDTQLIAIHPDLNEKSRGTLNMVRQTRLARHPILLIEN